MISIENYNEQFDIIIFTEGLTSFFWQICALLWPADYGELVSSHGSTTPENNDKTVYDSTRQERYIWHWVWTRQRLASIFLVMLGY